MKPTSLRPLLATAILAACSPTGPEEAPAADPLATSARAEPPGPLRASHLEALRAKAKIELPQKS